MVFVNDTLIKASIGGQTDIVKLLFEHGANIYNPMVLGGAVEKGHLEIVKWLLSHEFGLPLINYVAIQHGHSEIVRFLLSRYPILAHDTVHLKDAIDVDSFEIVKLLLDSGADSSANNSEVLRKAFWRNNWRIVQLLLDRGANSSGLAELVRTWREEMSPGVRVDVVKFLEDFQPT
jgi:hypothetical protein